MPNTVEIKLEGFQALEIRLKALGPRVEKNGLRTANYAGAMVIVDEIKKTAPERTGLMKSKVRAFRRTSKEFSIQHSIGISGVYKAFKDTATNRRKGLVGRKYKASGPGFYARFIEFGSSKYEATPFVGPAFKSKANAAIDAIGRRLEKAIEQAAKQ